MRILLLIIVLILAVAGIYSWLADKRLPREFVQRCANQPERFAVPEDSMQLVWERAKGYMSGRYKFFSGGTYQEEDSLLGIPWYNTYHKGSRAEIKRFRLGNKLWINCSYWYNNQPDKDGAKEIALYVQQGVSRYNFRK